MEVHRCDGTLVPGQLPPPKRHYVEDQTEIDNETHLIQGRRTLHVPYSDGTVRTSDCNAASTIFPTPSASEEGVLEASRRTAQHAMDAVR